MEVKAEDHQSITIRTIRPGMKDDIEKIYAKLVSLETEVSNLRQGYILVNAQYTKALAGLKSLTNSALEAAKRSAVAAEKALLAAKNSALAAKLAASEAVVAAAEAAADAAAASAEASIEAAAAASAAASAAAAATLLNFFHPYDATASDLMVHAAAVAAVVAANRLFGARSLVPALVSEKFSRPV